MWREKLQRNKHFVLSIGLHLVLFIMLFFSVNMSSHRSKPTPVAAAQPAPKRIVQAGLVNKQAIDKAYERQKKQKEAQQNELDKQRKAAQVAQQKAAQLKKESEKLRQNIARQKRQTEAEQKKAAEAKAQALAAKQNAEKAKAAQAQAHKAAERAKALAAQKKAEIAAEQKKMEAARAQARQSQDDAASDQRRMQWLDDEVEKYKSQIARQIHDNRTMSAAFSAELFCEIHIRLLPDGSINSVQIVKSSGNEAYDNSAEIAVYKAAPFIMPSETDLVQRLRDIVLGFRNDGQTST